MYSTSIRCLFMYMEHMHRMRRITVQCRWDCRAVARLVAAKVTVLYWLWTDAHKRMHCMHERPLINISLQHADIRNLYNALHG